MMKFIALVCFAIVLVAVQGDEEVEVKVSFVLIIII